jgi:hypothetical protein
VRIIEQVGLGGMGVVYRGWDEVLHRSVAVKFLLGALPGEGDPHFEQFLEGARMEAAIRHPGVVAVHSAGVHDNVPYLVMDFVEGPTLRQALNRAERFSEPATVAIMSRVADAVAVLHNHGIVHRDLKPGNIMFERDGHLLVTDFGLAVLHWEKAESRGLAGTPGYMAPEALAGKVGLQGDVYSMGLITSELVAGELPAISRESALEGVSDALQDVIRRATHEQEVFRYKSARQFGRALESALGDPQALQAGWLEVQRIIGGLGTDRRPKPASAPGHDAGGTGYFEQLSELAEDRRKQQTQPAEAIPAGEAIAATGSAEIVLCDFPCSSCEYNLRGLPVVGHCPECGALIEPSLQADRLVFADPAWLARIARGIRLLLWSVTLLPVGIVAVIIVAMSLANAGTSITRLIDRFVIFAIPALQIACLAAALYCTTPPKGGADRNMRLVWQCTLALCIGLACAKLAFVQPLEVLDQTARLLGQGLLLALVILAAAVVLFWLMALWRTGPAAERQDREWTYRKTTRAILIAWCGAYAFFEMVSPQPFRRSYGMVVVSPFQWNHVISAVLFYGLALAGAVALLEHLRSLALRLPDLRLARRLRINGILFFVGGVLMPLRLLTAGGVSRAIGIVLLIDFLLALDLCCLNFRHLTRSIRTLARNPLRRDEVIGVAPAP